MYYTYILQSEKDGRFYTGATSDLQKRLLEYNQNKVPPTKNRGPFEIIYYEACKNEHDAYVREKYLKSGQGKRYLKNRIKRVLFLTGQVSKKSPVYPVRSQSSKATKTSNRGFVALMSSIVISSILLVITVNTGQISFYNRFNILDSEMKEMSSGLADACLDIALLNFAQNSSYSGNTTVNVGENSCLIGSIVTNGTHKIFNTKGVFRNAHTNLKVIIDGTSLQVISAEEIPTY
ncbi:MAG: putative endonuclease [Parcubacteria group bacterium Gr01-1014_46]|nr:MAG: putative endonuclease [Parcubacteria group bacterium Gr01-1014_46]